MRELAHAYTEDTQVKWNGVLGRMELKAENDVKLQQVNVYPDIAGKRIKVKAVLVRTNPQTTQAEITLQVNCAETGKAYEPQTYPAAFPHDTVCIEKEYALDEDMRLWDEFSPALYTLHASCHTRQGTDRDETTFGMREIGHTDGYLTINGNRIFLRGTLECCIFPLTGTPPTDEAGWEKVFSTAKAWGLNHLRFHSYCPPEAAFKVADRMGFYLQVELPNWSLTVGKDTATNRFLYQEFDRIIAAYGNHPSFCMLSAGNELQPDFQFLNAFVGYMKRQDNRHLYTTTTFTFEQGHGTQPEPEDDFFVTQWTDKGWIRGQGVFDAVGISGHERNRELHRHLGTAQPESHPKRPGKERACRQSRTLPASFRQICGTTLQRRNRTCHENTAIQRLSTAWPARFPGTRHGTRRSGQCVLGIEEWK